MCSRISEIEIDLAADQIIQNHMLARRTKSQSTLIFEDMAGVLKCFQVAFVKFCPLALQIGSEISSDMRAFVPIEAEPLQSFVNCRHGFFGVARPVGVFDAQNEFAAVMSCKKPIEKRSARPANVQITGRRGGKPDADFGIHLKINSATDYTDFC